jgi:hypothetical protein
MTLGFVLVLAIGGIVGMRITVHVLKGFVNGMPRGPQDEEN